MAVLLQWMSVGRANTKDAYTFFANTTLWTTLSSNATPCWKLTHTGPEKTVAYISQLQKTTSWKNRFLLLYSFFLKFSRYQQSSYNCPYVALVKIRRNKLWSGSSNAAHIFFCFCYTVHDAFTVNYFHKCYVMWLISDIIRLISFWHWMHCSCKYTIQGAPIKCAPYKSLADNSSTV